MLPLCVYVCAGCHGHHGQVPAAEYLVTTAAHTVDTDSGRPRFLTWYEFLQFCVEQVRVGAVCGWNQFEQCIGLQSNLSFCMEQVGLGAGWLCG